MLLLAPILGILLNLPLQSGLSFRNLSMEQGLSNNTVSSVCQDGGGMIWMATKGGVNRFDGYDTKVFRYDPEDDRTIQSNLVNLVYADSAGTIWACTADGLARFDAESESFRRIDVPSSPSIESMTMVGPSRYILATRNETILYDDSEGICSEFSIDGSPVLLYATAKSGDCLVVGTTRSSLEFLSFGPDGRAVRTRPAVRLPSSAKCLLADGDSSLWIGTNHGLLHFSKRSDAVSKVRLKSIASERITALESDTAGNIWIGTKYGICLYNPVSGADSMIKEDPFDISEPSDVGVRSLFRDSQGNLWVCYSNAGLDFVNANAKAFHVMHHCPGRHSISGDNIRSLAVDNSGDLWIGTRYNSLNRYNRRTGELTIYEGIPHILCMLCPRDRNDLMYVGSFDDGTESSGLEGGVIEINRRTGKMRKVSDKNDVNNLAWADDGLVWAACQSGLYVLNPADGTSRLVSLRDDNSLVRVLTVLVDGRGHLWVGAKENLDEYEVGENHTLKKVTDPVLKGIVRAQVLHQGDDGSIWIGTSDGLFRYLEGRLEAIDGSSEMKGRCINSIQSDGDSLLWIGTDCGLYRYGPVGRTGKFHYPGGGRKYSQFNLNASCIGSDGTVYMGTTRGVVYFKSADIRGNAVTVKPRISGISVHNTEVRPGDGSGVLAKSIDLTDCITLRHDQDAFSFRFSCADYASEGLNGFEYRLDPFDPGWMRASDRVATYTSLRKGRYLFRVRASNSDGILSGEEAVLGVTIRPAWYESTFAIICFVLMSCAALALAVKKLLETSRARNEALIEDMRRKYETDMLKARLSSYTESNRILNAEEEKFLSRLIAKIEDRMSDQNLSVGQIASVMCMSRSNLHLKVSSLTGASTIELIKRIRVEKACELIKDTALPLSEIAEKAGFNSATYFSSCFRKSMGMSPSAYLSKVRRGR